MSTPGRHEPPRLARWLLGVLLPPEYREAVLGDLAESFDARCRATRIVAFVRAWYWRQVIHVDVLRLRAEARAERAVKGRGGAGMDAFLVEIKQALRVFRRNPGFVLAVVVTLAVGIGGVTSIFSLANGLLLKPIPGVGDANRLATIQTSEQGGAFGVSAFMDYLDFEERSRSFEALAAFKPREVDVSAAGTTEPIWAAMVTSSYFDVLGVPTHVGRFFTADVDEGPGAHPEVVLTHGLWARWFASDADVVGSELVLNGRTYTVIGITPPRFHGTSMVDVPELFVPMTMQPDLMPESGYLLDRRGWGGISIVGRLAEGVTHATAMAEIESIGARLGAEYRVAEGRRYAVTGFREAAMPGDARTGITQLSVLLLTIVTVLWLVVCLNVANLFLARSLKRRQELAVRLAMGAGRLRVTGQLVFEFMTLALAAAALGMAVARLVAGAVAALPIPILFDAGIDARTVVFAGALAVASGLLCALVPALTMSGTDPRTAAGPSGPVRGSRHRWPSRLLIVSQVSLSVVLLFTTALFVRTFGTLSSADPGFDPSDLLTARFNPSLQGYDATRIADFYARLTSGAAAIPGVEAVTLADGLPSASNFGRDGWFIQNATDPEQSSSIFFSAVSPNFFATLGIPIIAGRGFDEGDSRGRAPVLVVNEATARLIESRTGRGAVGQGMSISGPDGPFLEVVGVVGSTRTGREDQASPFVYGAHEQVLAMGFGGSRMTVMLRTSVPAETLVGELRAVAAAVDPNVSASGVQTMERFLDELLAADRLTVSVLGVSSALTLFLVALGLYGLMAYVVTQRTREFGIRLALGARAGALKSIVLRDALGLALAGIGVGGVGALLVTRLTAGFLVGVAAADPASMAVSIATVLGVAAVAAYVPARRAMGADPVVAMRVE